MDGSRDGLGAVLSQEQDGKARPFAYASRTLHPAEKDYSSMKPEFLGMKWAMTQKFCEYLLGHKCVVWTDKWRSDIPLGQIILSQPEDRRHPKWANSYQQQLLLWSLPAPVPAQPLALRYTLKSSQFSSVNGW